MFLETIKEEQATGRVAEIYAGEKAALGFVMSATACWTTRPDMLPIFDEFVTQVKAGFSLTPRDWRLITFVAAQHVPSTYCSTVYGKMLLDDLGSKEKVLALQSDFRNAGLDERDVAMLAFAETVAKDASRVTAHEIEGLRAVGFSDVQISDIALCAAFRCFVARYYDATGSGPEPSFLNDDNAFRDALAIGRKLPPRSKTS